MHTGEAKTVGGRAGDSSAERMSESLAGAGFELARFKTGTPCRLNGRTIDFSKCEEQPGDNPPRPFSFSTDSITVPQVVCHSTQTTPEVHDLIRGQPAPRAHVLGADRVSWSALLPQSSRTRWCGSPKRTRT